MKKYANNRQSRIMLYAGMIAVGLIVAGFLLLNRSEKIEVFFCLLTTLTGLVEIVKIPHKERNPLLED